MHLRAFAIIYYVIVVVVNEHFKILILWGEKWCREWQDHLTTKIGSGAVSTVRISNKFMGRSQNQKLHFAASICTADENRYDWCCDLKTSTYPFQRYVTKAPNESNRLSMYLQINMNLPSKPKNSKFLNHWRLKPSRSRSPSIFWNKWVTFLKPRKILDNSSHPPNQQSLFVSMHYVRH